MAKLWGGRFSGKTDPQFEAFSASFRWDVRLLAHDLAIDAAHVKALKKARVLSAGEAKRLLSAIAVLQKKEAKGVLKLSPENEDVHSAVHIELKKILGPLADKLHTGRSRNDLVAQSSRLYCKAHGLAIIGKIRKLQKTLVTKAAEFQDVLVPGMTHLQNAQVLSYGHILLAYVEMLDRAALRFEMAVNLADVCVLGSGALAGTTFDLDQKFLARELGLARVTTNSYDVSGDRDFILNLISSSTVLGVHFSRMAEDLMIGQIKGSGWIEIDAAFCTGSSMMPQKKNADFAELARGAAGVAAGNLSGFLMTLKGLPTSYNRDLQWDKKYIFETLDLSEELLDIFTRLFATLEINKAKASAALKDESLYATDLADYLVGKGVAFKEAHDQVGQMVRLSEETGVTLSKIGLDLYKKFMPKADGGVYAIFDAAHSVRMKKTQGSTHPSEVSRQISAWRRRLK